MKCIDTTFRTPLPLYPQDMVPFRITPDSSVLLIGSCFTDNIGAKLIDHGLNASVNPAGALYNPVSIAALLRAAISQTLPPDSIFRYDGRTRCWLLPTRFSHPDPHQARAMFDALLQQLHDTLLHADTLIITFGTSWVYTHTPLDTAPFSGVVGNCHKVPARDFTRRRLGIPEIENDWLSLLREIYFFRHKPINTIFTVSPIRHFKDGAHQNTLSKATLHLAIDRLITSVITDDGSLPQMTPVHYFPAWELLMDDLRDYRFYAPDMLHPSTAAVDYIWQYFLNTYFTPEDCTILAQRAAAIRAAAHRPNTPL